MKIKARFRKGLESFKIQFKKLAISKNQSSKISFLHSKFDFETKLVKISPLDITFAHRP